MQLPNLIKFKAATVFIIDKKDVERACRNQRRSEMVLDVVRRDVSNMERFCGHPALLSLVHPLEENAYTLIHKLPLC